MNASVAIQTLPQADNDEELIRIVDEVIAYRPEDFFRNYRQVVPFFLLFRTLRRNDHECKCSNPDSAPGR